MPSYDEARTIILNSVKPLGVERVQLLESNGRVIAEDVVSSWDMPLCDNSAMDGFAVPAGVGQGTMLKITGYIPAGGSPDFPVTPGNAVKIMTGAPIPPGCDAVVPVEETEEKDGSVTLCAEVTPRQHIRFRGEDVPAGETFIQKGTIIRPPEISMLASFGHAIVPVHRRVRVAILSTGDELIELGQPPVPGKIVNSNAWSLAASVIEAGGEPVILGIARDNVESHREKMIEGLKADVLITSAGVSAGDRDFVRDVLAEVGVEQKFWKVGIKPGGPTAFGMRGDVPVFSLPGNPVSTMITFEEFVRPALLRMMGRREVFRPFVKARLMNDAKKKEGKINFLRVRIEVKDGEYLAYTSGDQNTGILKTMVRADAIALLPADRVKFSAGEEVQVHLLRENVGMIEAG